MTEHHRLLSQGRFPGVLLMKSLRSDDEKSLDRASEEAKVLPFPMVELPPLPTHSWASLITPPGGRVAHPYDRPTDRRTGGHPTTTLSPSHFPFFAELGLSFTHPHPPPSLRFRPSVTKPNGPWPASSSRPRDRRAGGGGEEWMEDEKEEKEDGAISATATGAGGRRAHSTRRC